MVRRMPRIWDVGYKGLKLRLYPSQNYGDYQIVMHGLHPEEAELEVFANAVKSAQVFVDIGANVGIYTLFAAQSMPPGGRIIAFEPAPDTAQKLRTNIGLNGLTLVTVVQKAVAEEPGRLRLHVVAENNVGQHSLSDELGSKGPGRGHDVDVTTLQAALEREGVSSIDVLKIDVEGFEDRALYPFLQYADELCWPKYVLIEIAHRAVWKWDLISAFKERGYQIVFENAYNLHLAKRSVS